MTSSVTIHETIARLQKMEELYNQLISLSGSIASVMTIKDFHGIISTAFKVKLGFSHFLILREDRLQKEFSLFYHHDNVVYDKHKDDRYTAGSKIFTFILGSPEPVLLSKNEFKKIIYAPNCIAHAFETAASSVVLSSIASQLFKGVLCLGFDKDNVPDKNKLLLLQRLTVQLGISLANILHNEKNSALSENGTDTEHVPSDEISDNMGIVGSGKPIDKVRNLIKIVCNTESTVLIIGESGTGKELVAKAIHYNSERSKKPLIKINCAAIPKELLESELFGHEKGSFTGATSQKIGKFAQAHQGTLFLDDICEMPIELQAKLLRVLQEKEIQRIGSSKTIAVDTRIIAATNKDLLAEVHKGNFRADLFYRLNVFPIDLPPLRERNEDIFDLANFFIRHYCKKNKKSTKTLSPKITDLLYIHKWPGNVRELEHTMERAVLLSPDRVINDLNIGNNIDQNSVPVNTIIKPWKEFEKEYILNVINYCKGRISGPNGAASLLKIPPTTLISKMERLGIKKRYH